MSSPLLTTKSSTPPTVEGTGHSGGDMASQIQKSSSMFSQLEQMMSAVRQEAASLEAMKAKLKEMDEMKSKIPELRNKLVDAEAKLVQESKARADADRQIAQLRSDMQHLNDLYSSERRAHLEMQQEKLQLEQNLSQTMREVSQLQKDASVTSDLRKTNQLLNSQLAQQTRRLEEESAAHKKTAQKLEEQTSDMDKVKIELSNHFWNLSEELKRTSRANEEAKAALQQALTAAQQRVVAANEKVQMSQEECASTRLSAGTRIEELEERIENLNKDILVMKVEVSEGVTARKALESQFAAEREVMNQEISKHQQRIRQLTNELNDAQSTVHSITQSEKKLKEDLTAIHRLQAEIDDLKVKLVASEAETERLSSALRSAGSGKDEMASALSAMRTHRDALEGQLRDLHTKNWEAVQRIKELEVDIDSERHAREAAETDRDGSLQALRNDMQNMEAALRGEAAVQSKMALALKAELEKRLEELRIANTEREDNAAECSQLKKRCEELQDRIVKSESTLEQAMQADKTKMTQEIRARNHRIKGLESEKQELLKESSELMKQLEKEIAEKSSIIKKYESIDVTMLTLQETCDNLKHEKEELNLELRKAADREKELKDKAAAAEFQFKTDISRLDMLVKESRKSAVQQVQELSVKMKSMTEDLEEERKLRHQLETSERTAKSDATRAASELDALSKRHEDFQTKISHELATLRKESTELRSRLKQAQEVRSQLELDIMNTKLEKSKMDNELTSAADRYHDLEAKYSAAQEEMSAMRAENEQLQGTNRRLRAASIEMEQTVSRKTQMADKASREVERLEKEGFNEIRKLRKRVEQLQSTIADQKSTMAKQQHDIDSSSTNFAKLQQSTNITIKGLMEELKATEDALASERRSSAQVQALAHQQVAELQNRLEKAKEAMEERLIRSQAASSDKEHIVMHLESEVHRLHLLSENKEARIAELEKQRQADRQKIVELREAVAMTEKDLQDAKTNLAKEESLRQTLELQQQRSRLQAAKIADDEVYGDVSDHEYGGDSDYDDDSRFNRGNLKEHMTSYGMVSRDFTEEHYSDEEPSDLVISSIASPIRKSPKDKQSKSANDLVSLAGRYNQWQRQQEIQEGGEGSPVESWRRSSAGDVKIDKGDEDSPPKIKVETAEESIARTQRFLKQRRANSTRSESTLEDGGAQANYPPRDADEAPKKSRRPPQPGPRLVPGTPPSADTKSHSAPHIDEEPAVRGTKTKSKRRNSRSNSTDADAPMAEEFQLPKISPLRKPASRGSR